MASDEASSVERQPLQFSILSLLVLTTIVAIGLSVIVVAAVCATNCRETFGR